jgi:hypothetical protein
MFDKMGEAGFGRALKTGADFDKDAHADGLDVLDGDHQYFQAIGQGVFLVHRFKTFLKN